MERREQTPRLQDTVICDKILEYFVICCFTFAFEVPLGKKAVKFEVAVLKTPKFHMSNMI